MAEQSTSTIDLYECDVKECITGGSSHVDPTLDEQCSHRRPLGHTTPVRESSHKCFVGLGSTVTRQVTCLWLLRCTTLLGRSSVVSQ